MGPIQNKNLIYPKDTCGRKFSATYYNRKMENGEIVPRTWLFIPKISILSFVDSYNDWRNLTKSLHRHETSLTHMKNFLKWMNLNTNLKNKTTISIHILKACCKLRKKHRMSVLQRLVEIIKFLSAQNLAFRGSSDKLYENNNGNFIKLVELFAKFDPVMESHVERALQQKNRVHYLSKDTIRKCKYYSIILDCTPDASKTEQMTLIMRFVSCDNGIVNIRENFLGFVDITDSTGRGLCATLLELLEKWNFPIEDMRGQGYDNGANMKRKNNGLQKLLLGKNPLGFFRPMCCSYSKFGH
ncbi:hypothetical protein RI129_003519 [Pyrocoelia pectoralis]|uniref:DUF4371 domain-containing protein n=1 Tax=Pyrocoelia pectoralis TaxID=417401 RepID=A0AAN7VI49_9COLE